MLINLETNPGRLAITWVDQRDVLNVIDALVKENFYQIYDIDYEVVPPETIARELAAPPGLDVDPVLAREWANDYVALFNDFSREIAAAIRELDATRQAEAR